MTEAGPKDIQTYKNRNEARMSFMAFGNTWLMQRRGCPDLEILERDEMDR